jgi:hypothetical protein
LQAVVKGCSSAMKDVFLQTCRCFHPADVD